MTTQPTDNLCARGQPTQGEALKPPCPFCGAQAILLSNGGTGRGWGMMRADLELIAEWARKPLGNDSPATRLATIHSIAFCALKEGRAEAVAEQKACFICGSGNDLPDGEKCGVCGRVGHNPPGASGETALHRAVRLARGSYEPPSRPLTFSAQEEIAGSSSVGLGVPAPDGVKP